MQDIIAICGARGSGKNTAADMLQYICNTPSWLHNYVLYRLLGNILRRGEYEITSFAAPLKRTLAGLLNIEVERFEDRDFKENTYICIDTMHMAYKPYSSLSSTRFDTALKNGDYHTIQSSYITIRQFMQFIGTEVLRGALGDALWTKLTLKRAGKFIISDCRFKVEAREIKKKKGLIICLLRDGCQISQHASDQEMFDMIADGTIDKIIDNNGSKRLLFNKLCNI